MGPTRLQIIARGRCLVRLRAQSLAKVVRRQPIGGDRRIDVRPAQLRQALAFQPALQPQVALTVGAILRRAADDLHFRRARRQAALNQIGQRHADTRQRDDRDLAPHLSRPPGPVALAGKQQLDRLAL